MRICVVGPSKYFFSGITAHTIFLANALVASGNEVAVIQLRKLLPRFLYPGKKHLDRNDYLIDFTKGIDVQEGMDWNSPLSWIRACKFLKKHKSDAIIMLWWTSAVAHMQLFLAFVNRLIIGSRLILEMHETTDPLEERILPVRLYSRIAGKLLFRMADAYTVHSASVKNQVAKIYNINTDQIFIKPFGIYESYRLDLDKKSAKEQLGIQERYVILNFGSIRKYKGVSYLVKAFSSLPESIAQDARLVVAGEDWKDDEELEKAIESSPFKHKITLHSHFIADEAISIYFSAADVVVLPYLRSSGSGIANIVMAYGKPIVTSELNTMKEMLHGYQGALFTPVGDSQAIKERLIQVYGRMKNGDLLVYEPPRETWTMIVKQYEEILAQLKR